MKMKNRFFYLMLFIGALSMTLTSCNEDILPDNGEGNEGKGVRTVKLGVKIEAGTKVTLSEGSSTDQSYFAWVEGDEIGVWVGTSSSDAGGGFQGFTVSADQISGDIPGGKNRFNYAVYPNGVFSYSGGKLTVTLPAVYALNEVSGTNTPLPMVAVNNKDVNSLTFYNVGGMLRLTVNGIPADAKYLQVDFGGKQVCGDFTIASPNPGSSTISTSTISVSSPANAGDKIKITDLGGAPSATINIPLPIGEYGYSVTVSAFNSSDALLMAVDQTFGYTASRASGKMVTSSLPAAGSGKSLIRFDFKNNTPATPTTINNIRFVRIFSQGGLLQGGPITISGNTDVGYQYVYAALQFTEDNNSSDPLVFQVIDKDGKVYSGSLDSHDNFVGGNSYEVTANVKLYTFSVASESQVCFSPGDLGVEKVNARNIYSFTVPFTDWATGSANTKTKVSTLPNNRSWFDYYEVDTQEDEATHLYGITWRCEKRVSNTYEWDNIMGRTMNLGVSPYYKITVNGHSKCLLLPPDEATSVDIGSDITDGSVGTDFVKYLGKGFVILMDAKVGDYIGTKKTVEWKSYYGYWQYYNHDNRYYLKWASDTNPVVIQGYQHRMHARLVHDITKSSNNN